MHAHTHTRHIHVCEREIEKRGKREGAGGGINFE